jgi:hypothetical protein
MSALALFFSPRGTLAACTWVMAFGAQTLAVWLLTRPVAAAAGLASAEPSPYALPLAAAAIAVLWSMVATTAKRIAGKGLPRLHLVWILLLWLLSAFFGGAGDPVAYLLTFANILTLLWLGWPAGWRLPNGRTA